MVCDVNVNLNHSSDIDRAERYRPAGGWFCFNERRIHFMVDGSVI